ncbi:hypothetical protein FI667_g1732, partial [Globisporangium splendens]
MRVRAVAHRMRTLKGEKINATCLSQLLSVLERQGLSRQLGAWGTARLYFDGGARCNPGPGGSGWALIFLNERSNRWELKACGYAYMGPEVTNNWCEYSALKDGLAYSAHYLQHYEAKLEDFGDSHNDYRRDLTMQNVAYYIKSLPDTIDRQIPCFLVDICGPLLSVFGIVNVADEDAICEPLVMSFPLLFLDNEWLMASLARVCVSLKAALRELTNEWHQLIAGLRGDVATDLDRLRFPHKDRTEINGSAVTLRYVEVLQRYVFVAKYNGGNEVIVKFVKRYGKEVHEYCANLGFAPALLYYEALPSGWVFVVMEKLPLKHLARAQSRAQWFATKW